MLWCWWWLGISLGHLPAFRPTKQETTQNLSCYKSRSYRSNYYEHIIRHIGRHCQLHPFSPCSHIAGRMVCHAALLYFRYLCGIIICDKILEIFQGNSLEQQTRAWTRDQNILIFSVSISQQAWSCAPLYDCPRHLGQQGCPAWL